VSELAADGIPVAVTCRVLKLARQPYYRWRAHPVTDTELEAAYRANALFDAHRDDSEFGYRFLADEARDAGVAMANRTAWRICSDNGWWSAFARDRPLVQEEAGRRSHETWCAGSSRRKPEPAVAGRHHRASDEGREALPVCGQRCLLQPDRRYSIDHRMKSRIAVAA